MKTRGILVAAALLAALAAGCAKPSTSGMTVGVDVDEYGGQQEMRQVDDKKVAKNLVVGDVVVGETKNGLMKVNVRLSSKLNKTYTAQTKFAWFDESGMEIDPEGDSWRPLTLQGKETKTIQGVAPNASATSFRLRVREGEKTRWIIK
jgi:uncharacterized protein YcfL